MSNVDLTAQMPQVIDQGSRPTCLACAASDAHQILYAKIPSLSIEALFHGCAANDQGALVAGTSVERLATVLANQGQPEASVWPYLNEQPRDGEWHPPETESEFFFGKTTLINPTFTIIQQELEKGRPVIIGMKVRDSLLACVPDSSLLSDCGGVVRGLHAVLVVGFNLGGTDTLFIRNSWGTDWGDNGHTNIGRNYLEANVCVAAIISEMEKH
ncbi:MAG: C1 family peptidase [Parasphingorhabdus sp.]